MLEKSTFLSVLILTISSNLPKILLWTEYSFFLLASLIWIITSYVLFFWRDWRGVWNRSYWGPHYPLRFSQFRTFVIVGSDRWSCQALCFDQSSLCILRSRVGLMFDHGIYVYMLDIYGVSLEQKSIGSSSWSWLSYTRYHQSKSRLDRTQLKLIIIPTFWTAGRRKIDITIFTPSVVLISPL